MSYFFLLRKSSTIASNSFGSSYYTDRVKKNKPQVKIREGEHKTVAPVNVHLEKAAKQDSVIRLRMRLTIQKYVDTYLRIYHPVINLRLPYYNIRTFDKDRDICVYVRTYM